MLPQYQLSNRQIRQRVKTVRALGLVPVFAALVIMLSFSHAPGPGLWAALGLSLGLELALSGVFELCRERDTPASRLGAWVAGTGPRWFGFFLYGVLTAFAWIIVALLWITLSQTVLSPGVWMHANVAALAVIVPVLHLVNEAFLAYPDSVRLDVAESALRHLRGIFATTLLAAFVLLFLLPDPAQGPTESSKPPVIVVAIVAGLIVLVNIGRMVEEIHDRLP